MSGKESVQGGNDTIIRFGQRRRTKICIQISKGRRRAKEDDKSDKDDSDGSNSPEEMTPESENTEAFSSVDLSSKLETEPEEKRSSRSDQFFDRLKRSGVGKLFNNEAKDPDISIYTIDQSMKRGVEPEVKPGTNDFLNKPKYNLRRPSEAINQGRRRCVASQANDYPPYRLYFLPPSDWRDSDSRILKLIFCQCSLATFLLIWLLSGTLTFYLTEGPYEEQLVEDLNSIENSTMVSMATDLRLLDPELDPWDDILTKYAEQHRLEVITLIKLGYKNDTVIWTFPGSLMCAVSILTTLGIAAPLPQTIGGSVGGIMFALIGIPIHIIFILNLGRCIATRVQIFAKEAENKCANLKQRILNVRKFGEDRKRDMWPEEMFTLDSKPPSWLSLFPFVSSVGYYLVGLLVFGVARGLSTSETFLFFLGFARGYPSNGFSRMGYSWYLEGGAILMGLNIAILRDSPLTGITQLALPYDLVTNSLE